MNLNRLPIKNRSAETAQAGFTIVEMIVVVTVVGFLAAVALGAHAKVANDAKIIKYKALISTLAAAKSAWLADPATTARDVETFNAGPEANFAMIAPYIRVHGAQPTNEQHLLSLSAMPNSDRIRLGTVDDSSFGGQNSDETPTVSGHSRPKISVFGMRRDELSLRSREFSEKSANPVWLATEGSKFAFGEIKTT